MLDNQTISELNNDPTSGESINSEPSSTEDINQNPSINEMRTLVGLEPINDTAVDTSSSATQLSPLIDADDFQDESQEESTKRKIWQQPIPKMIAVAAPLGVLCFIAGFILINLSGMELANKNDETENVQSEDNLDELADERQREEIARLRTANALGNQASVLEGQPTRRTEIRPAAETTPTRVSAPTEVQQPQQPTSPPATPPTPISRSRPIAVSRAPIAPRQPTPRFSQSVPPASQIVRSQARQNQQASDPFSEWQRLAAIGSYGQVSGAAPIANNDSQSSGVTVNRIPISNEPIPILVNNPNRTSASTNRPTLLASNISSRPLPKVMEGHRENPAGSFYQEEYERDRSSVEISSEAANSGEEIPTISQENSPIDSDEALLANNSYEAGVEFIMNGSNPSSEPQQATVIMPGTIARGEVISPVAWAEDIQSTSGAVELTEDLISDGKPIMPAGTQLIVELNEISDSGMMSLAVTSIILPGTGYEHIQIPASAISINGSNGQVLMGQDISGVESELQRLDLGQAFLGALGRVGSVLNRPSSSSTTVGLAGSVSSTNYDSPNILGAVLEGSANTIINERIARNQQRADELQQRPPVWVLSEGTGIEIFINQAIEIGS